MIDAMLNLPAGPLASYLIIKTSNRTVAGIGVILIFISNLALAYSTNLTMMIVLHSIPASIARILWNCITFTAVRFNVQDGTELSSVNGVKYCKYCKYCKIGNFLLFHLQENFAKTYFAFFAIDIRKISYFTVEWS